MKIAVTSGKGGTGKTTVSVSLALSAPRPARLLDCDVEEPDCHLFLPVAFYRSEYLTVPIPLVNEAKCNGCGECGRACQFNAIAVFGKSALVFPELCHGCGGCAMACQQGAISEGRRHIGQMELGRVGELEFVHGRLKVGEPMAPPLIRAVLKHAALDRVNIIDTPPGTACPMVSAVRGADYALLVTEPTPFGLHDLGLAVNTVRAVGLPLGVVINRSGLGDRRVNRYCDEEAVPVLAEIPDDRRVAEAYSRGEPILDAAPGLRDQFDSLWDALLSRTAAAASTARVET